MISYAISAGIVLAAVIFVVIFILSGVDGIKKAVGTFALVLICIGAASIFATGPFFSTLEKGKTMGEAGSNMIPGVVWGILALGFFGWLFAKVGGKAMKNLLAAGIVLGAIYLIFFSHP